jgi:oligosaccharide repeat unit polymerase
VLHKAGGENLSIGENVGSVFSSVLDYLLGGVYAFNSVIRSGFMPDYGENTLRFFIAAANSLGLTDSEPKPLVMPFINNPVISNVYSVYYPYAKDFWYFGILFNALWAYIHSWLYYRVKRNFIILFLYSILLYPLIMSFFQDQYMSLFSTWLQMIFLACIALPFIRYSNRFRSSIHPPLVHA